jgi:hypothetical protein
MTAVQQEVLVEVLDRPQGSTTAPKRLGYVRAVTELRYRRALDNNEWARFRTLAANFPSWLRPTHVLRAVVNGTVTVSGAFEEFRIDRVIRHGQEVTVECRPLFDDFTTCGLLTLDADGEQRTEFTLTKTVSEWLTFIRDFHRARGFTYWDLGTVTPANSVTVAVNRWTPQQLIQYLTTSADIGLWEDRMEYDTAAGVYKLHIVQQYNSAAPTLRVIGGQNILSIEDEHRLQDFIAGVQPSGEQGTTAIGRSLTQVLWKVSSVSTGKFVVADPNGDSTVKCIGFDDQFNAVGHTVVAQCVRTGLRYTITDSVEATQELYTSDTTHLIANDYVELFYVPAGTTLTKMWWRPNAITNVSGRHWPVIKVGTVTGASLRFAALDPSSGAVSTLIHGRNCGLTGMKLLRSTTQGTQACTNYNTTTKRLTVTSTAGYQAGDWIVIRNTAASNFWLYRPKNVKSVVDGTTLELEERVWTAIPLSDDIPNGALASRDIIAFRPQADVYIVTKCTGYQNFGTDPQQNVWVDTVTNLTAGDHVEPYFEVGGLSISELFSPTALAQYPQVSTAPERRARDVVFSRLGGEPNLLAMTETHFDDNVDDFTGNVLLSGSPTATAFGAPQNGANMFQGTIFSYTHGLSDTTDNNKFGRFIRLLRNPFTSTGGAATGRFVIALRIWLYSVTPPWTLTVSLLDSTSNLVTLATYTDSSPPPGGLGDHVMALALDPTAASGAAWGRQGMALSQGVIPYVTMSGGSFRVDAVTCYWAPDPTDLKADKVFLERGQNALWSKANAYLALYHVPPRSLRCEITDLWRMDQVKYAGRRTLLGSPVSVYNEETSTDLLARVTAIETLFAPNASVQLNVDFNTQQEALSRRLVEG